ncbi:bucky ball-like isoform X1 [Halichoeres trimaculatus]|uniref:bucky ball-like isoform X1 n=1 Tax=Halichoeres trimaculatus TaxID=147232 RepID=UPI003D9F9850
MENVKQPHIFGAGQQRTHHPRPFFYVQPPSQPYYLYQHWQMSNPYSHFGLPGGFNFNRACVHPYQYMQYPGFVYSHAPMYPMDYRRVYEPRFHNPPPWSDAPWMQHHQQPQGRREMACSEVQTDPSDTITKLIECLDNMRASEQKGADRELDSGVASQSSFSPTEEKKSEEQGHVLPSVADESHCESPVMTFSDSTTAVYDGESSRRSLEGLGPHGCWTGGFEEPLDSSSVHEESPDVDHAAAAEKHFPPLEREEVTDIQPDISMADLSASKYCTEELTTEPNLHSELSVPSPASAKSCDQPSKTCYRKADPSYKIFRLPVEGVLTSGEAAAGHLPSHAAPYHYNYLSMHSTHERMSVLSPSLDELSSRDEMFSTDLDDPELFPKHVYPGRRLTEVSGSPHAAEGAEKVWLQGSKRSMCTCCGKSLAKGGSRSKVHGVKVYRDEAGDTEEEGRYGRGCEQPLRVGMRRHSAPRKNQSVPVRHAANPWYKRGQYKDPSDPIHQEDEHDVRKPEAADSEMAVSELQRRTCQDKLFREELSPSDQARRGDSGGIPWRRQATQLQQQEMSSQWKVMHHRPHDEDEDEPPPLPWERGSTLREPRC